MFNALSGRKVLITGHTGFCGSWLSQWLRRLGSDVYGVSLPPNTDPNLFDQLEGWTDESSFLFDLATPDRATELVEKIKPELVFHLAAQPLVRQSYADTPENWRSNVMGTVEVLEAIRRADSVRAAVMITTDKVYENLERDAPYDESDRLGGKDPYSASKSACEMAIASYRDTIFEAQRILCASARGGNIVGGGDWSSDRLIPDIVRSLVDNLRLGF
ncbi:MAG: CDP-glucose 4,6-dehydratase [Pseudomonadota bacterium]